MNFQRFHPLIFFVVAILMAGCTRTGSFSGASSKDTLYDRVMASGKIRCGYFIFPPYCMKDPNSKKLSGIFVEALDEAARNLNLSIDWTEEVGYGSMVEGLKTNRYDLVPTGVWPNANRGRYADFSLPLFYSGILVYVRSDDKRFDKDLTSLNTKSVTISTIDGTVQDLMARKSYPKAQVLSHPEMSEASQILLDVTQKKADVTFIEPGLVSLFLKNNPQTLKCINGGKPVGVVGNTMMFKIGEPSFKAMLNNALQELINTGYIDNLIDKYEPTKGAYFRVAPPYESSALP